MQASYTETSPLDQMTLESIDKDIARTSNISPDKSGALKRILYAFANKYPHIGYCQVIQPTLKYFLLVSELVVDIRV